MVMTTDVPDTLFLSYENLAAEVSVAEVQKDVLTQFLRTQFRDVGTIVEGGQEQKSVLNDFNRPQDAAKANARARVKESLQTTAKSMRVVLRCIQCGRSALDFSIDRGSIRAEHFENEFKFQASFRVALSRGPMETWRVALFPDESGFCVRARTTLSPTTILSASDFEIKKCKKEGHTAQAAILESEQLGLLKIEELQGFRVAQHISAGAFLDEETLRHPIAVKAYESVKVVLDAASGFQIKTVGKVLHSAAKGETVKVELQSLLGATHFAAKRTIDAVVVAPGEVSYVR